MQPGLEAPSIGKHKRAVGFLMPAMRSQVLHFDSAVLRCVQAHSNCLASVVLQHCVSHLIQELTSILHSAIKQGAYRLQGQF
jgi:hypothetical protein